MVRSNDELQRKYHIPPEMNDEGVLSLYTKKPMNFSVRSVDRQARAAVVAEIEEDLEIRTADCQSIFLYDPVRKAVANVHSGWRGTLQGIAVRAVELMQSEYGCRSADIRAYVNPSILDCCFEVEDDVISQFANVIDVSKYSRKTVIKNGRQKYHMDTAAINRDALIKAGLLPEHILQSGVCTVCRHDEFHSYRADAGADGRFGLNGSIICLK